MRSMVEGHAPLLRTLEVSISRGCPSTTLRVVPLPQGGGLPMRAEFVGDGGADPEA
jgi:hypothetical protein